MIEHRKFKRFKDNLVVVCSLPGDSRLEEIIISDDISQGGIRVTTPENFLIQDVMNLEINVYCDAVPFSLKGRVVWTKEIKTRKTRKKEKKYQLGLEFVHADNFSQDRIFRYISRASKKKK